MKVERVFPNPNALTAPYWKAAREHRLTLPRCGACGRFHSYPRSRCPHCSSDRLTWTPCSGEATVYSYTEVLRAPSQAFAGEVPYVVAIVELAEGPHLMTRLVGAERGKLAIGQKVQVEFDDMDDEIALPVFRVQT